MSRNGEVSGDDSSAKEESEVVVTKVKKLTDPEFFASLPEKQLKWFKKHRKNAEELEDASIVCTGCFSQVNHKLKGVVVRHPVLGVPICKNCKKFYHSGTWTKDEDGYFEYCRWCAQGGELLMCQSCANGFCKRCIKRNLGRTAVSNITDSDDWECLVCDPMQIKEQRAMYYSLYMYWKLEEEKEEKRIARTKEREVPKDNSLSKAFASTGDCLQIARKAWDTELRKWRARKRYDQKTAKHAAENLKKVLKMTIINLKKVDTDLDKDFKADFPDSLLECPEVPENGGELPFSQSMEVDDEDEVVMNGNSEQPMDSVSDEDTSANEPVRTSSTKKQSSKEQLDRFDTSLSPIDEVEDDEVVVNGEAKEEESAKVKKEVVLEDGDSDLPEEERENKIAVLMSSSSNEDEKEAVQPSPTPEEKSPRKKLRSKKELDKLRHHSGDTPAPTDSENEAALASKKKKPSPKSKKKPSTSSNDEIEKDEAVAKSKESGKKRAKKDLFKENEGKESDEDTEEQKEEERKTRARKAEKQRKGKSSKKKDESEDEEVETTEKEKKKGEKSGKDKPSTSAKKKTEDEVEDEQMEVSDREEEQEEDQIAKEKADDKTDEKKKIKKEEMEESEDEKVESDPKGKVKKDKPGKQKSSKEDEEEEEEEEEKKKKIKLEIESKPSTSKASPSKVIELNSDSDSDNLGLGSSDSDEEEAAAVSENDDDFKPEKNADKEDKESRKSKKTVKVPKSKLTKEEQLQRRFQRLINKIDVDTDEKLKGKAVVELDDLSDKIKADLKKFDEVYYKDHPELTRLVKGRKKQSVQVDDEIARLCNLGALKAKKKKSKKKNSDDSDDDDSSAKKKPSRKPRASKKKAIVESDEESEENGSVSDDDEFKEKESQKRSLSQKDVDQAAVLASSSSDEEEDDEEEPNKAKGKKKMNGKKEDKNNKDEKKKSKSRPGFMNVKLDETDSSEAEEKAKNKRKKKDEEKKQKKENGDKSDEESDEEIATPKKKKLKKKKAVVHSDSSDFNPGDDDDKEDEKEDDDDDEDDSDFEKDGSDSDVQVKKKKKSKRKKSSSSDEDSDDEKPKKKRRRIKKNSSSEGEGEDGDSPNKGRKHIRKIIKDKNLSQETKSAAVIERDRRKRMEERQQEYNKTFEVKEGETLKELPLDFDPETKEVLVEVDKRIVKKLKPHQAGGIKFMWDACFETKADVEDGKCPGGAILAHCMGLGKTLQTIGLIHTVMSNFPEHIQRCLVLCPVNTVKNWADEFDKWLKGNLELDVYEMSGDKDNWLRADRLSMWMREGGVMIMGYDMFRNLSNEVNKRFKKKQRDTFQQSLVDPGPDLVVCDEGHILKNTKSALNAAMTRIKTRRRIILTGTPLQNNLSEYYAMVEFVKPKLLGTYIEFKNRFVNPIQNGQHSDSTDKDVRVMKKRSFILSDLLKGCMQRLDYNVLVPYLQPKYEYVLCLSLTPLQKKLYQYYLENFARAGQIGMEGKMEGGKKGGLFYDVQNLSRIWNHPYILLMAKERADIKKMFEDDDEGEEGSLKDFIDDNEASEASTSEGGSDNDKESDCELVEEVAPAKRSTRNNKQEDLVSGLDEVKKETLDARKGWWEQHMGDEDDLEDLENGTKMMLLMDILKECELLGDKVLVFSQSLLSLDLIESFLKKIDDENKFRDHDKSKNSSIASYLGNWQHGRDYFRMDGSTAPDVRKKWCNYFNKPTNHRIRLFLISTKAGGLGINLVAANRVIIFDASWNPAHDVQSIFRVYRFGQEKPVYIYRFLAKGTMEEKIYDRQVTKQSLSARVVDEQQIERHFSMNELTELYEFKDEPVEDRPVPKVPDDRLLADLMTKHKEKIWKFHDHDSLLENQEDENLTEEERKAAWEEFENEKKGIMMNAVPFANQAMINTSINPQQIQELYRQQYPHYSHEQIVQATRAYIMQMTTGLTHRKPSYDKNYYQQEMAKAKERERLMQQQRLAGMASTSTLQWQQQAELIRRTYLAEQALRESQLRQAQQVVAAQRILQQAAQGTTTAAATTNDDDGDEIVLDGAPQLEEYDPLEVDPPVAQQTSSRSRRGRPRLDPDSDDVTVLSGPLEQ